MHSNDAKASIRPLRQSIFHAIQLGASPRDLLRDAGLEPADIHDANTRLTAGDVQRLWTAAEEVYRLRGVEHAGLAAAHNLRFEMFDTPGLPTEYVGMELLRHSRTLRRAVERYSRFYPTVHDGGCIDQRRESGATTLTWRLGEEDYGHHHRDYAVGLLHAALTSAAGAPLTVRWVDLGSPQCEDPDLVATMFGDADVRYGSSVAAICYDDAALDVTLTRVAPATDRLMEERLREVRAQAGLRGDAPLPVERVVAEIAAESHRGSIPSADSVAAALGISRRTLSRHLRDHQETFRGLRDRVLATRCAELFDRGYRADEVASALGYADVRTFSRARARWVDVAGDSDP